MDEPTEITYSFHEGHEHDDGEHGDSSPMDDEDHPMWRSERLSLTSVGIDIGSSTSHLIFSRMILRRQGIALSSRFVVVKRDILHESPILLTPYVDKTTIDTQKLDAFIAEAYRQARLTPKDIDTGAVIVTGEAAKKKNAEAIVALFSAQAGKFVCASAGHNLEAILSAFGSGAVEMSYAGGDHYTVMNVDIGGGTSKIAIAQKGAVIDTAALEVGARLVAMDREGKIERLEDTVLKIGEAAKVPLHLGKKLEEREKEAIAEVLCNSLFEALERGPLSPLTQSLMLTPEVAFKDRIDAVIFSGGVSEYVYGHEKRDYGDLGNHLGRRVWERAQKLDGKIEVKPAQVRIRATVIGASQYTVQVSGNTIYLSDPALLPLRNLQVVTPHLPQKEGLLPSDVKTAIERALTRFDIQDGERP